MFFLFLCWLTWREWCQSHRSWKSNTAGSKDRWYCCLKEGRVMWRTCPRERDCADRGLAQSANLGGLCCSTQKGEHGWELISPLALLVWTLARSQISWSAFSGVRSWTRTNVLSASHTQTHTDTNFITSKNISAPLSSLLYKEILLIFPKGRKKCE